jgi:hypothetical protein
MPRRYDKREADAHGLLQPQEQRTGDCEAVRGREGVGEERIGGNSRWLELPCINKPLAAPSAYGWGLQCCTTIRILFGLISATELSASCNLPTSSLE